MKGLVSLKEKWYRLKSSSEYINFQDGNKLVSEYGKYVDFVNTKLDSWYIVNGVSAHPLNRFVPTDLKGNVLVKPNIEDYSHPINEKGSRVLNQAEYVFALTDYKKALDRVLFEGFKDCVPHEIHDDWVYSISYKEVFHVYWKFEDSDKWELSKGISDIESLVKFGLTLTPIAINLLK